MSHPQNRVSLHVVSGGMFPHVELRDPAAAAAAAPHPIRCLTPGSGWRPPCEGPTRPRCIAHRETNELSPPPSASAQRGGTDASCWKLTRASASALASAAKLLTIQEATPFRKPLRPPVSPSQCKLLLSVSENAMTLCFMMLRFVNFILTRSP